MLRKIQLKWAVILMCLLAPYSCSDYLDLIPDNIPTLDYAFKMRSEAERYLYTCYWYMPRDGALASDPSIMGGDEFWSVVDPVDVQYNDAIFRIARGFQNASAPLGGGFWASLYQGIRVCNIFLENVGRVPDLPAWEREQWAAEVLFLKAYYHSYLVRMYGPIPLIRENLPIGATSEEVRVSRDPVDDCFKYIVELIDQALPALPLRVTNPTDELGRITRPIAAAWKAKMLVTAASPLFNGNNDQATLVNPDGTKLFNPDVVKAKWDSAVVACKKAIEICHEADIVLYNYETRLGLSDTIVHELTIRNTFNEKWNSEIIWANTQSAGSTGQLQTLSSPHLAVAQYPDNYACLSQLQPPVKIAEMYHTNHGLPIDEDKDWQSVNLMDLRTGTDAERYYIRKGYTTIQMHFDREPRFYACLGFDGGIWYGQHQDKQGNNPDTYFYVACRVGGDQAKRGSAWGPYTGYFWKKSVHFQSMQTNNVAGYTATPYTWPIMRLADLYLLYAEAINESEGPNGANSSELFEYIDRIRTKAWLRGVKYSYDNYASSDVRTKYDNQTGMRAIIHRERLIELSLEGQRFWDLRRWKEAPAEYSKGIEGYKITESDPTLFYKRIILHDQVFSLKDYFWPIQISNIEQNPNLVQNIGW